MLMMQKHLVVLNELTEFNISFISVMNVFPVCCQVRNTLNNMSVKRWMSFYSDGAIKKLSVITIVTINAHQTSYRNIVPVLAMVVFQIMSR